jgi:hypothetical protein
MRFKIQYFKEEKLIGERPWNGTYSDCRKVARDGLVVHSADNVKVIDGATGQEKVTVKWRSSSR